MRSFSLQKVFRQLVSAGMAIFLTARFLQFPSVWFFVSGIIPRVWLHIDLIKAWKPVICTH